LWVLSDWIPFYQEAVSGSNVFDNSRGTSIIESWGHPPPALPPAGYVCYYFRYFYLMKHGLGGSVGIATDYWLDGPGSNPGGDKISRPSRPALGPTQLPVPWVLGLSWGKVRPGDAADHSPPSSATVMEK